ncbi:MAG: cysteine--tRNA ligase [Candidatus Margulisiibacteriota bacterium]|nr:cysteine--tRNA ligase [Candidatus Margulisiibacteriota bacterium]
MSLKIYNTLSKKREEFIPIDPPNVKMYVCGITPYDETHLGHGRAYVTFDLVRRYLEESDFKVEYIQNITDIDDKIIKKSQETGETIGEVADKYTASYLEVMDMLNVERADSYPKATDHITEMVRWTGGLVDRGYAYVIDGDVYYEVDKFRDYGKLSKRKKKDLLAGARVKVDERKKNPLDFALWKSAKEGEPSWDSPWGKGRPGWHIECSVMSTKYLGEQFDIHGGGRDLIFPHHENEIAQAEAETGRVPWVKYWVHNGFVNINKQKMSKSLGNFFTLREIFEKFDPMVVRFFLLLTHYRSPINYSDQELSSAREAYGRICKFIQSVDFLAEKKLEKAPTIEVEDLEEDLLEFKAKFREAMDDDFNSAGAIAAIFEMIHFNNKALEDGGFESECLDVMKSSVLDLCTVLGLKIGSTTQKEINSKQIEEMIEDRNNARSKKDFTRADHIRDRLKDMGIEIEDTPYGTRWKAI